ncbi:hypothetical protein PAXRUDRAFT_176858, partial [Paxillus rubicundulus Ve08.2h10]
KYSYSQETLTSQLPCQYCNQKYKPQGLKKHEASCKHRHDSEKDRARANKQYEKDVKKGEFIEVLIYGVMDD